LLKKIELDLLLADLAFKRRNSTLRSRQLLQWGLANLFCLLLCGQRFSVSRALGFGHTTAAAQSVAAAQMIAATRLIDALAWDLPLTANYSRRELLDPSKVRDEVPASRKQQVTP
jgi:hypothetical protein